MNTKKCHFGQLQQVILGHIIPATWVQANQSKIKDVVDWPNPIDITDLPGFLGLTCYYRLLLKGYALIAGPLNDFLRK